MDAEKLAKKVSEKLGTFEKRNFSEKTYENSEHRYMKWRRPRSII